ncbi:MAG TPA: hypothetical protein DHV36_02610 [Desulfobacteraceae bacterium]|nr:hypothetical protein [Desulfobacteraceae bacterium]|tara:strand:- start:345 stop:875 length:531 start_codon:yes stop_codon:yes gene_type:complete
MGSSYENWGVTTEEREIKFPCDRFVQRFSDAWYRGISICAGPDTVFKWLCQMRVAPYSYDWIDNFGRKSPQALIPGLDHLEIGQPIMTIFELIDFEPGGFLTISLNPRLRKIFCTNTVITYLIVRQDERNCRLLVKIHVNSPKGLSGKLLSSFLCFGDWVMMRRQLLNFKKLCEQM